MSLDERLTENKEAINLRKRFPMSLRSIFRRSWNWILAYFLCVSLLIFFSPPAGESTVVVPQEIYVLLTIYVVTGGLIVLALKLFYEFIFHVVSYYGIESDHLVISRNVFLKHRASFPLAAITDVHLDRGIVDFIFALYDLRIATPHLASARYSKIEGLSRKNAIELQDYLTSMIETLHPQIRDTSPIEESKSAKVIKR